MKTWMFFVVCLLVLAGCCNCFQKAVTKTEFSVIYSTPLEEKTPANAPNIKTGVVFSITK